MITKIDSQNNVILAYLLKGKGITPLDALQLCGCFRLSARIHDLRGKGFAIDTEMVDVNGKRVARYRLKEKETEL